MTDLTVGKNTHTALRNNDGVIYRRSNRGGRAQTDAVSRRLPAVAENGFLHPIQANFGGLNAGEHKTLNTLIYQCIYGILL
jgi:hypothetical protein